MKICEKCGAEFDDDFVFCPTCGGRLAAAVSFEEQELVCPECGTSIPAGFDFCPMCGTNARERLSSAHAAPPVNTPEPVPVPAEPVSPGPAVAYPAGSSPAIPPSAMQTAAPEGSRGSGAKKKPSGRIVAGVAVAIVIIAIAFMQYTSPRDLIINNGDNVEVYVGDEYELPVYAEGLSAEDLSAVEWTTDDYKLLSIENGVLTASYDKNSFNATQSEAEGSGEEACTYTSHIKGHLEKGLRSWDGDARVVVTLKPVEIANGAVIKEPADSKDSYIEITGSDSYSTFFYLKSSTKAANDMSFFVKQGESATIYVPCDTYTFYEAAGTTWYGEDKLFGPTTYYSKDAEPLTFTSDKYWTLKLGVIDGNTTSEDIDSEEFPE